MTEYCTYHKNKHDHYEWRHVGSGTESMWLCRDAIAALEVPVEDDKKTFSIGASKTDSRIKHWRDITSRVTTHDGQFLQGKAGKDYQKRWSKQMLGKDLSRPVDFQAPSFQKELAKTK